MTPPDPTFAAFVAAQPAGTSDADVATAANVPTLTPRTSWVTFATLCSAPVGGFAKAAGFRAEITAAAASQPAAAAVLALLDGVGFNPADPQAAAEAAGMVALASGTITQADAQTALYTTSYAGGGTGQYVAADVTAARAWNLRQSQVAKIAGGIANDVMAPYADPSVPMAAAGLAQQFAAVVVAAGVA